VTKRFSAVVVPEDDMVADWRMSPAIKAAGFLFLTGMTGARTSEEPAADPEGQITDAFEAVCEVLAAAGAGFDDVVEMTSYHLDIERTLPTFRQVRDRYVSAPFPAWTAIGVSGFATPGVIAEIRVIALAP